MQRSRTSSIRRPFLIMTWIGVLILGACSRAEPTVRVPQEGAPDATATRVVVATSTHPPLATESPTPIAVEVASPTPWIMVVVAQVQGNVRSAPSDGGKIVGAVPKGESVEVLEFAKEWYRVEAKGLGEIGWMHQSVLAEIITRDLGRTSALASVELPAAMVIVAKQAANVRSGPSENLDAVAQLPRGATVDAQSRSGEWFKVAAEGIDGTGWVHQDVLRLATEADLTPETVSTPSPTRVAATALPTATNPPPSITPMVYDSPVQMVVVAREAANIRSEPADEGDILGSVVRGAMVVVYEARDGWYRVRAEDLEGFGWIYGELLSPDPLPD